MTQVCNFVISETVILAGLLASGLALIHLYGCRLHWLRSVPRSRWLSLGSGVSVAYVFVHILPDLSSAQSTVQTRLDERFSFIEHHAYLMALVGMLMFYGLERVARQSRQANRERGQGDYTQPGIFWLHMVSFALYNALIGYLLLHREEPGLGSLLIYAGAMALHFVVNDYGLREDHKKSYDHKGRWILAGAVIFGWVLGSQVSLSEAAIATLFAFLAGGIILNVLKEELPEENESRFWVFALGAGGYSAVLLSL